jgi:hypothetical protein
MCPFRRSLYNWEQKDVARSKIQDMQSEGPIA